MKRTCKSEWFILDEPIEEPEVNWTEEEYHIERREENGTVVWYGINTNWKYDGKNWYKLKKGNFVKCLVPEYELLKIKMDKVIGNDTTIEEVYESNELNLTVGKLKRYVENLPDQTVVMVERVEDKYFNNNWQTLKVKGEWYYEALDINQSIDSGEIDPTLSKISEEDLNSLKSEFYSAWSSSILKENGKTALLIHSHY